MQAFIADNPSLNGLDYNDEDAPRLSTRVPLKQYVYFIGGDDGPIKIGIATDPVARLAGLQVGSPTRLQILATVEGGRKKEWAYHNLFFARHRLSGEWFSRCDEIMLEIERLNNEA